MKNLFQLSLLILLLMGQSVAGQSTSIQVTITGNGNPVIFLPGLQAMPAYGTQRFQNFQRRINAMSLIILVLEK